MPRRGENIRKRKDGRWEARYPKGKNDKGRTVYGAVYGATYKEAKEKRRQLTLHPAPAQKGITFQGLLTAWLEDNRVRLKASTLYRYQYLIDTHIAPALGHLPLSSITAPIINSFLAGKRETGRLDGAGGLSAAYVKSITLIISSALRFGAEQGLCALMSSQINKPTVAAKELSILSKAQQQALEKELLTQTDETKLGIYLSLYTGLRIGEICALTWEDVDLIGRVICVRNTVVRVRGEPSASGKTKLLIDTPKTNSSLRSIPICSDLMSVLTEFQPRAGSRFVVSKNEDFVSPRTFDYRFKKILNAGHLPPINFHALRHTFATRCIEAGVDVKSLSEMLGHANSAVTLNIYVHSSMELKRAQLEKLSRAQEQ